ncbi:helix-turn-helix domain-containing protein [Pseudomonas sp. J452]|uniref:GlxA family transcriptional regulator n=1 Tax=Pseudomonas sp. J452 TaxID=2898441 RepID=UPI0021ADB0AE|nr:helix-turn-helix domain-containing protein [Pseudomonas sp. J452]UUY08373.1 helix-turn-helix domain-containing protein [Pseudomonas sp. J452]
MLDIFSTANYCIDQLYRDEVDHFFSVKVITEKGEPVVAYNGQRITPDGACSELDDTDIVIVAPVMPAIYDLKQVKQRLTKLQAQAVWLKSQAQKGCYIGSVCTGSLLLAEAGLLQGRSATTHWKIAPIFHQLYPGVELKKNLLVVKDGPVISAGGSTAYFDLCLSLIKQMSNNEVMNACTRLMIFNRQEETQSPYEVFTPVRDHNDQQIQRVQDWLEFNYHSRFTIDELASRFGMQMRNFQRRFRLATGEAPNSYLQKVRVEAAKNRLQMTSETLSNIIEKVGYDDISSFSRLFKKITGLTVSDYRMKFSQAV